MNTEITTPIKIWQPKDGESLIGQIVDTRIESGIYGENRQVLVKRQIRDCKRSMAH